MASKRTSKKDANPWPGRVRALLAKYDLTQKQLGSRLGLTNQAISTFVTGTRIPAKPVQMLIAMMEAGDDLSRFEK